MINLIKNKISYIFFSALFILSFVGGYFIKELLINQKVKSYDYLSINDPNLININKFDYYAFDTKKQEQIPVDLKEFLIKNSHSNNFSLYCWENEKKECSLENSDYQSTAIDLNNDGTNEYIILPWKECGCSMRGANGNGEIYVIGKKGNEYKYIGYLRGNGFIVLKNKTNGYNDLLINFHSTAATGNETIYKVQTFSNGMKTDGIYEESFSKWYDSSRVKK